MKLLDSIVVRHPRACNHFSARIGVRYSKKRSGASERSAAGYLSNNSEEKTYWVASSSSIGSQVLSQPSIISSVVGPPKRIARVGSGLYGLSTELSK